MHFIHKQHDGRETCDGRHRAQQHHSNNGPFGMRKKHTAARHQPYARALPQHPRDRRDTAQR